MIRKVIPAGTGPFPGLPAHGHTHTGLKLKNPFSSVSCGTILDGPSPFEIRTPSIGTSPAGVSSYTTPETVTSAISNMRPSGSGAGGSDGAVGPRVVDSGAPPLSQADGAAASAKRRNAEAVRFVIAHSPIWRVDTRTSPTTSETVTFSCRVRRRNSFDEAERAVGRTRRQQRQGSGK